MEVIAACRVCGSGGLKPFFDLGKQPLANSLLDRPNAAEKKYSLSLSFCPTCSLVQLNETIPPEELFSHYVWVTGTSRTAREFAGIFSEELERRTPNLKDGYVLEVASNDGTFLKPFMNKGYRVLGVDPAANVVQMANKSGIPTECFFWGRDTAETCVKKHGPARAIFARNVLAHVADTRDFVRGLVLALEDGGTLAIEVHYGKVVLDGLQYDSIYHEHLCYFTLKNMERLLKDAGLTVFDVLIGPISGGALIVYARKGDVSQGAAVAEHRAREASDRTNEFASWEGFAKRCFAHKEKLLSMLKAARPSDLIGWGASARSSTMLNFCGITPEIVPAVIDLNPLKQGKFTAGTHIPIVAAEEGMKRNPKTVFIMAWNFADEIIDLLHAKHGFRGACIVPLPNEPRTVKM